MAPFPLSSHFNKEEFACNDGCGEDFNVPPELINIIGGCVGAFQSTNTYKFRF